MVVDQVHGLQATGMSLNDRFTMLASAPAAPVRARTPRRRPSTGGFYSDNMNRNLIEQIARRLEQQAKRQTLRQRLGVGAGGLRRFGSESSLAGLRRSNSFGDLSQRGVKSRLAWRQSNGNLNRSASFGNLSRGLWRGRARGLRGVRRLGGRVLRGRLRGGVNFGRVNRFGARTLRGRPGLRARGSVGARGARGGPGGARGARGGPVGARGGARGARGGAGGARGGAGGAWGGAGAGAGRGAARGAFMRGATRGRGRGGIARQKPVPTKEELDLQLDQYMAGTKTALDKELDAYMEHAMDLE